MQSSGKQPPDRHDPHIDDAGAETKRAPTSAVNAILARLGLVRESDEAGEDATGMARDLTDPSWTVRVQAVQKLGKMGKQAPLELLLVALSDEQGNVRAAAARALGRNPRPAAIAGLVKALEDREWVVRAEAALALGHMRDLAPLEPLLAATRDKDASVRAAASRALGEIGTEQVLESLAAALQDRDWLVREAATLALGQMETRETLPSLLNARMDEDLRVRKAAEAGLRQFYPDGLSPTPPPSDSFAQWLERTRFPQSERAADAGQFPTFAGRSVYSWRAPNKSKTPAGSAQTKKTRQKRLSALVAWSRKITHLAEGALAAILMVCLIVAWLVIATQPRTPPVQLGSNRTSLALTTYRAHDSGVEQVAWSPDGQTMASADLRGTVCLWQASTGRTLQCYPNAGKVLALTWNSVDALLVAYGEPNQSLQVQEYSLDATPARQLLFQQTDLPVIPSVAAWSADNQTLAFDAGDGLVRIRNVIFNLDVASFQEKHTEYSELAWSADNNQLAALSTTGQLQIWNPLTGQHIATLADGQQASIAIWISSGPGSSELFFDNLDGAIMRWWYNANGQNQQVSSFLSEQTYNIANISYLRVSDLALSPDGNQLLLATTDGIVQARDSLTGNVIYIYTGHSAQVDDIAWAPDGQHIATASMDTTVQIWQEP